MSSTLSSESPGQTATRLERGSTLASELARLRARVETIEHQLPDDARDTGVYAYATKQGVRWRIALKLPDGTLTTRRGFRTREAAAREHDRITATGPPEADTSFACFWRRWLAHKQPYLTEGSLEDLETHGRSACSPTSPTSPSVRSASTTSATGSREMTEEQRAGAITAKTVNNARSALSGALADASRLGLLPAQPLPVRRTASSRAPRTGPTSVSPRSTATSEPPPRTTGRLPNCSSAPARASPKRSR